MELEDSEDGSQANVVVVPFSLLKIGFPVESEGPVVPVYCCRGALVAAAEESQGCERSFAGIIRGGFCEEG